MMQTLLHWYELNRWCGGSSKPMEPSTEADVGFELKGAEMPDKFDPAPKDRHAEDPKEARKADKATHDKLETGSEGTFPASGGRGTTSGSVLTLITTGRSLARASCQAEARRAAVAQRVPAVPDRRARAAPPAARSRMEARSTVPAVRLVPTSPTRSTTELRGTISAEVRRPLAPVHRHPRRSTPQPTARSKASGTLIPEF
jgi:hypothetical protein